MQVFLDGNLIDPAFVDPQHCRYVGMWRPPSPLPPKPQCDHFPDVRDFDTAMREWLRIMGERTLPFCPTCHERMGEVRSTAGVSGSIETHWLKGCFDVPSYETKGGEK